MSSIRISSLSAIGSELFQDSESFLQDLQDYEIKTVTGGLVISQVTVSIGVLNPPDQVVNAFRLGDTRAQQTLRGQFKAWFDFFDQNAVVLSAWWKGVY